MEPLERGLVDGVQDEVVGIANAAVTHWFSENVARAVPPLSFTTVAGGHSCLTFLVQDAVGQRFVLRRPPVGTTLATAHDVTREHRIQSALQESSVPLPRMLGVCTEPEINGVPFYVMSYVEGVVLHDAATARALMPSPDARQRASESLVDALVALHEVDTHHVGLGELGGSKPYLDRQLIRWSRQWKASVDRAVPDMDRLHDWLWEHRPAQRESRIVHGDFRLGNLLHAPDGSVNAVLDWELCTVGDPMADLTYLLHVWTGEGEVGSDGWAFAPSDGNFPTRTEIAELYAKGSGRAIEGLEYWDAFNAWRDASIAQGVYRRYADRQHVGVGDDIQRWARRVDEQIGRGLQAAGLSPTNP